MCKLGIRFVSVVRFAFKSELQNKACGVPFITQRYFLFVQRCHEMDTLITEIMDLKLTVISPAMF